jgi:hypothetical protein
MDISATLSALDPTGQLEKLHSWLSASFPKDVLSPCPLGKKVTIGRQASLLAHPPTPR